MATRTVRSLILGGEGLQVFCTCGHSVALTTAVMLAQKLPLDLSAPAVFRRLTCKKCRRRGTVEARLSNEHAPFSAGFNRRPITAPQLLAP